MYYDPDGNEITQEEWARLFFDETSKFVAKDVVEAEGYELLVSTVWVGVDHSFGGPDPHIFETIVFGLPDNDEPTWRYATREAALEGHRRVLNALKDPLGRYTLQGLK